MRHGHTCRSFWLACVIALAPVVVTAQAAADGPPASSPRPREMSGLTVRTTDPELAAALEAGVRRSPTFRGLLERLAGFDVIVYLERTPHLPRGLEGCLLHWVGGARTRLLKIQLSPRLDPDRLVVVLGHELQHAVEAASDPSVVDGDGMRRLFERIGVRRARARDSRTPLETAAALEVGEQIGRELGTVAADEAFRH